MRTRIKCFALTSCLLLAFAVIGFKEPVAFGQSANAGQAVLQKVCGSCHALGKVTASRRSREQWEEVTDKMIAAGAKATEEEFTVVINYLVTQYGRVNVNTAPASEIVEATGLSEQEAEAIIKYRKDKGKFEDFDALSKTPGVAVEKLEKSRDAISF